MDLLLRGWHWHIEGIIPLILFYEAYLICVGPLRRRFGWADRVERRQIIAFSAGVLLIFLALFSPIHDLSGRLFSAHMVQHVLLTVVMPPLLLLGTPTWLLRPLLRFASVVRIWRRVTHPILAFALFNLVFAMWHLPVFYNATLGNVFVHELEHVLFMATGVLVWWPILSPLPELSRLSYPALMVYLFLLSIAQTPLFAILTFSDLVLYPGYIGTQVWGISTVTDQQVGGIIMKMVSAGIFLLILTIVFFRWFSSEERQEAEETELYTLSGL